MSTASPARSAYSFLEEIEDVELRGEIRLVLVDLQLISEAKAVRLGRGSRDSEHDYSPPEYRGLSQDQCPSKDRSLFEHYAWRFNAEAAKGNTRGRELWFLLWEAIDDFKRYTVPPTEVEKLERMSEWRDDLESRDEDKLAEYVVQEKRGVHAFKVHLDLHVPKGWVEKVREDAGMDPVYGNPRQVWRQLPDEEKLALVAETATPGRTQRDVAKILGVSLRTVIRHWPSRVAA